MVDLAGPRSVWTNGVHCLCDMGGVSGRPLLVRIVLVAILLARAVFRSCGTRCCTADAYLVWSLADVVAVAYSRFTRLVDPYFSGVVPIHMLLLPERVLPGLHLVAAGVCGRRAAPKRLQRRVRTSALSESAPLRALPRIALYHNSLL